MVLVQRRLRRTRRGAGIKEIVVGIQGGVPEEFKSAPMEVVRAGLGDDVNVGARIAAVAGIVVPGLNLELLYRVRIWRRKRTRVGTFLGGVRARPGIHGHTVLQVGVLANVSTIHGDTRGRLAQGCGVRHTGVGSRGHGQKVRVIPSAQRKRFHAARIHHSAQR